MIKDSTRLHHLNNPIALDSWSVTHGDVFNSEVFEWRKSKLFEIKFVKNPRGLDMTIWYVDKERTSYTME